MARFFTRHLPVGCHSHYQVPVAIWEIRDKTLTLVEATTFRDQDLRERQDLQLVIRDNIGAIAPDTMVLAEEYGDWTEGRRRIDLLCLDRLANLVVVELKRTEDGGHMDLQALRYAAMISTMTFAQALDVFRAHLARIGKDSDAAESELLDFLEWDEPQEDDFANDVRIVLASAEFSRELTTTVLWLNDRGIDVRCVRLKPYRLDNRTLLDVQQIVPLPEVADYQVRVREKSEEKRRAKTSTVDLTRYNLTVTGQFYPALWKRHMVFRCVRAAVENAGAKPEDLAPFIHRGNSRWRVLDGYLNAEEFEAESTRRAREGGPQFAPKRYFAGDEELFHVDGRTYAFSNQWSGENALSTVDAIRHRYPNLGIDYQESETS